MRRPNDVDAASATAASGRRCRGSIRSTSEPHCLDPLNNALHACCILHELLIGKMLLCEKADDYGENLLRGTFCAQMIGKGLVSLCHMYTKLPVLKLFLQYSQ